MKNLTKLFLIANLVFGLATFAAAQQAGVVVPRESQRATVAQTVGDTNITIVYHRPSAKGREVWGKLVKYDEVWRTGANENTTFETSENVKINGQELPAGKYGLHTIPSRDEWTIIFSKVNNAWGSFSYDQKQDQLRVKAKPQAAGASRETMLINFDAVTPTAATVVIEWEKLRVPFMVEAGDVQGRTLARLRQNVANSATGEAQAQLSARMQAANYILDNKIKAAYTDAGKWVDEALKMRETFSTLRAKARISAESGNYKDAVTYGEKAVTVGRAAQPPVNAEALANFEKDLATWRTKR